MPEQVPPADNLSAAEEKMFVTAPRRGRRWTTAVSVFAILLAPVAGFLFVYPSPIDSVAYQPPPKPEMTGALAPNDALTKADVLAPGKLPSPEDVAIDGAGRVYTCLDDGRVVRLGDDGEVETLANTGGRPLGLDFAPDGRLIVADGLRGVLAISPDGDVEVLTSEVDGRPFGFADHLAVASDGRVYFSDASSKYGVGEYLLDMLEGRPHGRLLRYDPATKRTEELLGGLYFANGVALSPDEDFVLVNETYRHRVTRYWLAGPKAGQSDTFADNLPGYPDNLSASGRGTYWVPLFTVRNDTAEWLAPRPFWKQQLAKLPASMWPKPERCAFVVELDADGNVVRSLQDPGGERLFNITAAVEHDGTLYLGSLLNDRLGRYTLP